MQALLGENFGGDAHLAFAAVDHEQIRCGILARDNPRRAPRQRLARRRVVVAADRGLDVEAPVFAALHGQAIEDHAARYRGFAHGVADVEAFDALCRSRKA